MKSFKKRLTPMNARGASPSFSSTSSVSSSYAQPFRQRQQQHEFRTSGNPDRSHLSRADYSSVPPEIIIRALKPYNAQSAAELSVKAGDFLQVICEASHSDGTGWFESIDPFSGARGFVPIHLFQIFSSRDYQPTRPLKESNSVTTKDELKLAVSRNPRPISLHQKSRPSLSSLPSAKKSTPNQPSITRQPLYGVVRFNFVPQRNDELYAKKGEAIVLIAHSHQDWFVAKPIGRLGGPGLIPVSYVEVKDLATGKGLSVEAVINLMRDNILPGIEEWKQATAAYRGNSIPLGRFENPTVSSPGSAKNSSTLRRGMAKSHQHLRSKPPEADTPVPRTSRPNIPELLNQGVKVNETHAQANPIPSSRSLDDFDTIPSPGSVINSPEFSNNGTSIHEVLKQKIDDHGKVSPASGEDGYATVEDLRQRYGLFTHATVASFHKEEDQFWFHLRLQFSSPSSTNSTGQETTNLVLYRLYEDFFDFHAELLDNFPTEAGLQNYDRPSIFPKLPEPKDKVDELICSERVNTLSSYLEELSKLPSYIRDCEIFYEFLGPREGDVELLQESTPSDESSEPDEKFFMDEIEQLNQSERNCTDCRSTSHIKTDNESQKPLHIKPPCLKRQSPQKVGIANSGNKHSAGSCDSYLQQVGAKLPSQTRNPRRRNHTSNFSSSSTASFIDSITAPVNICPFPEEKVSSDPKSFHRIKVYQENNPDVIAIKATNTMTRTQLLQKIIERVYSFAPESPVDKRIGKLFIKDETKDSKDWEEIQNDSQLSEWLSEYRDRPVLLYKITD